MLEDKWFYGDSVLNYLKYELEKTKGSFPSFKGRVAEISNTFSVTEQEQFLQDLIDNADSKVYKWLRLSFSIVPKKVFDVYLKNLIFAHENDIIGNNNFFEWIVNIPKESFYKNRLMQYINYLSGLDINHKTYKPKIEKAIKYLSES